MSKKIVTYVLTLAMIFSVFSSPALGYATTEASASDVTNTTAAEEPSEDTNTIINVEEPSDDANQTDAEDIPVIGTVTGLKASAISHTTISLEWDQVEGATEYQLYRYNRAQQEYVCVKTVSDSNCKNGRLAAATAYTYKVRACITTDDGTYSGEFSEAVKCKTQPYVAKVTNVKAAALSSKTVKVSWNKVSGAKYYQVYRYNKAKGKYVLYLTTKKLNLKNTGLKADTQYSYKVRAYIVQDGKKYYGAFSKVVKCKTEKTDRAKISSLAVKKLGCQYKYGAKGPTKFDCSGFVHWVYDNADVDTKVEVPQTSSAGMYSALDDYMIGSSVKSVSKAKTGDIIFFKSGGRVSHVGIYYKDGKMIHAANPEKDVCIESVSKYDRCGYKVVGIARVLE